MEGMKKNVYYYVNQTGSLLMKQFSLLFLAKWVFKILATFSNLLVVEPSFKLITSGKLDLLSF